MEEITVHVVKRSGRPFYFMRYTDPITGNQVSRSTKEAKQREAEKVAAKWEAELCEGRYSTDSRISWEDFREKFENERLPGLAKKTGAAFSATFNHIERVINPQRLSSVPNQVNRFHQKLRAEGKRDTTLAFYLRHMKVALRWAHRHGMLAKAPVIEMPKRAKGFNKSMRGRPITTEEYERMLKAVPKVRKLEPEKWKQLLTGLWLSGLRLGEALALSWDETSDVSVCVLGKFMRIRILAEGQKRHVDELLPITPDFAELLEKTPENARRGLVFGIYGPSGRPLSTPRAGRYISDIGEKAGVVVNRTTKKVDGEVTEQIKYASAHDLRRAFGTRWAGRVMPAVLQRLMRHSSVETTMKFYVTHEADDLAADLWEKFGSGDHLGDHDQKEADGAATEVVEISPQERS